MSGAATTDRAMELAERALRLVRDRAADAETEVTVRQGSEGLTRFATGFIHQNVASETNHVLIRVALDGRNASTSVDGPGRPIPNGPGWLRVPRRPPSTTSTRQPRPHRPTSGPSGSGRSSTRPAGWRRRASARRPRSGSRSPTAPGSA